MTFRTIAHGLLAILAANLFALPALALCQGQSLLGDLRADQVEALDASVEGRPYARGRLWEVTRDGKSSLILGTIHLPDPELSKVPEAVAERLKTARILFLEIDKPEEQRMQRALMLNPSLSYYSGPERLSDHFSGDEWARLSEAVIERGLDASSLNQLKPHIIWMTLALPRCAVLAQFNGTAILDREVERVAIKMDVPVDKLETYEELLAILESGTYAEQVEAIRLTLPALDEAEDQLATLKHLYLEDEILKIWEFSRIKALEDYPAEIVNEMMDEANEMLLVTRNNNWMKKLVPAMSEGDVVVAVGALHLGGPDGLLTLLEQEGFAVSRVSE